MDAGKQDAGHPDIAKLVLTAEGFEAPKPDALKATATNLVAATIPEPTTKRERQAARHRLGLARLDYDDAVDAFLSALNTEAAIVAAAVARQAKKIRDSTKAALKDPKPAPPASTEADS